jgi:beta-lactamase superfamily II metal-dependent hydrolase
MIFTLEALQALYGDSLILHYGSATKPRWIVIDGGPSTVYANALKPRLEELRSHFTPDGALPLDAVIISHIDEDHIKGIEDLLEDLSDKDIESLPYQIGTLWHNAFNDIVDDDQDELGKLLASAVGAGAAAGAARAAAASDLLPKGKGKGKLLRERTLVAASVGQGRRVRDLAADLTIAVNRLPKKDGTFEDLHLIMAPEEGRQTAPFPGGPTFTVLGPLEPQVRKLQKEWSKQIAKAKKGKAKAKPEALAAAYLDKSVFNLSSIVVLAELEGRQMLLTGDARGDYVLKGLEAAGLLNKGKIDVDILKLPHHGSDRNTEKEFFEAVTADHYVISANGKYDNPDIDTLRWIAEARGPKKEFQIHLTNRTGENELGERIDELLKEKKFAFLKNRIVARPASALGLKVDLLEPVTY